jgi:hypothetical protein
MRSVNSSSLRYVRSRSALGLRTAVTRALACRYPIGVPLRLRPVAQLDLVDSPIWRGCTPTLFPATLGLHLIHGRENAQVSIKTDDGMVNPK